MRIKTLAIITFLFANLFSSSFLWAAKSLFITDITESAILARLDQAGFLSFATQLGAQNQEAIYKLSKKPEDNFNKMKLLRLDQLSSQTNSKNPSSWYSQIENTITKDVLEFTKYSNIDTTYSVKFLSKSNDETTRVFDYKWLHSKMAGFKLVALVNRMDRFDFDPTSCGEMRLIYRLGYYNAQKMGLELKEQFSMLPVFLNLVYKYGKPSQCKELANFWKIERDDFSADAFANYLLESPLNNNYLSLTQIELNMQMARFSSGNKTDFGGSAVYSLRIFKPIDSQKLEEEFLENTPDVIAIQKSSHLRDSLLQQLTNPKNLSRIDEGTFKLENTDNKLLAKRALSFSTTGHARLSNRPFSYLFLNSTNASLNKKDAQSFEKLNWNETDLIKSPYGLIERMDNMTCMGCHQANSTAGFHALGRYLEMDTQTNRTALAFSPHSYAERLRRESYIESVSKLQKPNSFRPLSHYPLADWKQFSGLKLKIPAFKPANAKEICLNSNEHLGISIPCQDPRTFCSVNAKNSSLTIQYGECVFKPEYNNEVFAGMSCRAGHIENALSTYKPNSKLPFNFYGFNDKIKGLQNESMPSEIYTLKPAQKCGRPFGGIPMGRVGQSCENETAEGKLEFVDSLLANPNNYNYSNLPNEICTIRGGNQFDSCAGTNEVIQCLSNSEIRRTMIDICYEGKFCREDYLCQQLPIEIMNQYSNRFDKLVVKQRLIELNRRNIGFCVPNYFVFNMRIDGHPLPEGRKKK